MSFLFRGKKRSGGGGGQTTSTTSSHYDTHDNPVTLLQLANDMAKRKTGTPFSSWIHDNGKDETEFTYDYVWNKAGSIAYRLVDKYKLKKGDRVILCYGFGLEFFITFLGCLRAGIIAVPVYPPNPTKLKFSLEKLQLIVDSSGATVCLCDDILLTLKTIQSANIFGPKWPKQLKWESTEKLKVDVEHSYDCPDSINSDIAFLNI